MNSDSLTNLANNIAQPLDNNKYVRSSLILLLIVSSGYFVPHPLFPKKFTKTVQNNRVFGFLLTLLLAYLLTRDFNSSVLATILVFALSYLTENMENFEQSDYVSLLVNENNAKLDRTVNKPKFLNKDLQFKRPQDEPEVDHSKSVIQQNTCGYNDETLHYGQNQKQKQIMTREQLKNYELAKLKNLAEEQEKYNASKVPENVDFGHIRGYDADEDKVFSKDNLRFLNYDSKALNKFKEDVLENKLPMSDVQGYSF